MQFLDSAHPLTPWGPRWVEKKKAPGPVAGHCDRFIPTTADLGGAGEYFFIFLFFFERSH